MSLPPRDARSGGWIRGLRSRVTVAYAYDGIARDLVRLMKFNGRSDIADRLGKAIADQAAAVIQTCDITALTTVPLHPARVRERGFDQILAITESLARILEFPLRTGLIRRVRNTLPQSRLSNRERMVNLEGAFEPAYCDGLNTEMSDVNLLLIDDVIHTGATVFGCLSALMDAGYNRVNVFAAFG